MTGGNRYSGRLGAVVVLALLGRLPGGSFVARLSAQQASALVLQGVTIIDVTDGRLLSDQTVVVAGPRIRALGPSGQVTAPAGAQLVDARGKFLIPGLWDMHAHTEQPENLDVARQDSLYRMYYPLYIAHGITGIREMAQRFPNGADSFRVWQRAVQAGARVGPRAIGPSADLTTGSGIDLQSPANARHIIDSLKAAGDPFAKFHGAPDDPEIFFGLLSESRRVGLPIAGHLPTSVSPIEAADSGIRSIEHIDETRECMLNGNVASWDSVGAVDTTTAAAACASVAQALVRNGTWLTPTLFPHYMGVNQRTPTAAWSVRTLHRAGVRRFLAGTDCGQAVFVSWGGGGALCPHGSSLLVEVVLLVGAGLTPLEALQSATLHPAQALDATDSLGAVAAGKLADLVLLDADPLADISNVLKVWAVVANGRYFDRVALDALDPEGTKPGSGLVARQRRFDRGRSRGFAVGADTIEIELTDSLLVHFAALWKEIDAFWPSHPALLDSAKSYEDNPVIPVSLTEISDHGGGQQITVYDYVTLAAEDPALAALFKKHGISPQQVWPLQVTLKKAALRREGGQDASASKLAARNMTVAEAHRAELNAAGFEF